MQIYIHRDNEDFGPYSREAVLEYVKQEIFQTCDYACYAGMSEWKTVSELLGIGGASAPARGGTQGSAPAAATRQLRMTRPIRGQPAKGRRRAASVEETKRSSMIAVTILLIRRLALGGYIRLGGGGGTVRHYFETIWAGLSARPAGEEAAASALPAPVIAETPVAPAAPAASAEATTAAAGAAR